MGELGTNEHTHLRLTLVRMGLVTRATGSWIMSSPACRAALSLMGLCTWGPAGRSGPSLLDTLPRALQEGDVGSGLGAREPERLWLSSAWGGPLQDCPPSLCSSASGSGLINSSVPHRPYSSSVCPGQCLG